MKILITGANGFIGSSVVSEFDQIGTYDIFATDIGDTFKGAEKVTYIKGDFSKDNYVDHMIKTMPQCDVIIHIGALINYDLFSKDVVMTNCYGVQQIIKLAEESNCKKIIFMSSVPVIGKPINIPVTEEHSVNPPTAYHASKVFAEHLLEMHANKNIIKTIFRLTSPIGKGMPSNRMLSVFINNINEGKEVLIYGKGIRKQNYVDARDIARAIDLACQKDVPGIFNIAGEKSFTSIELAKECGKVLGKEVTIGYKDVVLEDEYYDWEVSIEKANKILGYIPKYSLEQSIKHIAKEG